MSYVDPVVAVRVYTRRSVVQRIHGEYRVQTRTRADATLHVDCASLEHVAQVVHALLPVALECISHNDEPDPTRELAALLDAFALH